MLAMLDRKVDECANDSANDPIADHFPTTVKVDWALLDWSAWKHNRWALAERLG